MSWSSFSVHFFEKNRGWLYRLLRMRQSRWSVYSGCARAAPAYTQHAPQRLPRTLSKRPSFGKHFRVTLYHTECAPQPLKRTLSVRRSHWIVHWECATAAETYTECAPQPLNHTLSVRPSRWIEHWVLAAAAELVTLAYTACMHEHKYLYMYMYIHERVHDGRTCTCPITIVNGPWRTWS